MRRPEIAFAIGFAIVLAGTAAATAGTTTVRCDNLSTADLSIDGMLDDWPNPALARVGSAPEGQLELRCSWDGAALAVSLNVVDDRLIRVRGAGHQDRIDISVAAGAAPLRISVLPGNAMAPPKITKPAKVAVADSLQPKGFSVELRIPASQIAGMSGGTSSLELRTVFHDSDRAVGGDTFDFELAATIELGDRKDLLDDFLRTVRLRRTDIKVDTLANLDPGRRGKERLIAGGTVIGVLTDQFAFVSLPAARAADVIRVEPLALGRGHHVIAAVVRQYGNGGNRDLLMLWTFAGGQLAPLAQIEVRKEMGTNLLEADWKLVAGKKTSELRVEPKPAVGWTAATWNETPANDVDSIVLPWDSERGGVAYAVEGGELTRRDLPVSKTAAKRKR
ncbi:MAG: hypothetical protein AB7O24_13230 [Kofleriaceae bacterium]